jgi:starch phosphorylase
VLTIGFARRFATYKRATLFFHDLERAARILNDPSCPVQLVFAGKAHPADGGGQALIKSIVEIAEAPEFKNHVFFLEGYDMGLARRLVQGVDVWLNNPERPQEASGTSGQKASLNGVPNCSIRDGWWDEAFNGRNGWAFGGPVGDDEVDSEQLYEVLERSVIPSYYDQDAQACSATWLAYMREAIRTVAPTFSAQRMVKDYVARMYR